MARPSLSRGGGAMPRGGQPWSAWGQPQHPLSRPVPLSAAGGRRGCGGASGWHVWAGGGRGPGAKPRAEPAAGRWCWPHAVACRVRTCFSVFPEDVSPLPRAPASTCRLGGSAASSEVRSVWSTRFGCFAAPVLTVVLFCVLGRWSSCRADHVGF